jgi:hypothetical protein
VPEVGVGVVSTGVAVVSTGVAVVSTGVAVVVTGVAVVVTVGARDTVDVVGVVVWDGTDAWCAGLAWLVWVARWLVWAVRRLVCVA